MTLDVSAQSRIGAFKLTSIPDQSLIGEFYLYITTANHKAAVFHVAAIFAIYWLLHFNIKAHIANNQV